MGNKDCNQYIRNIGSPKEYSDGVYLIYVELYKTDKALKKIISKHAKVTKELEFGYLCEAHMQAIPEIVRSLAQKNHAVYQVVRLVKLPDL